MRGTQPKLKWIRCCILTKVEGAPKEKSPSLAKNDLVQVSGGDSDQKTIYSVVSTTRRKSGQEFSGDKDVAVVMQLL